MTDASADIVVVGGGSAGCIVASQFSAAGASVIVLEAGPVFSSVGGRPWPDRILDATTLPVGPDSPFVDAAAVTLAGGQRLGGRRRRSPAGVCWADRAR